MQEIYRMALEILPSQKRQFIQKIIDNGFAVLDFSFPEERIKENYQGSHSEFDKYQDYYHIEVFAMDKTNYYRFKKGQGTGIYDIFYAPGKGRPDHEISRRDWVAVIGLFDYWLKILKGEMDSYLFNKEVSEKKTDISSMKQNESTEVKAVDIVQELEEVPVVKRFDQIYEEAIERGLVRINGIYNKESDRYYYNEQFIEWLREKRGKTDIAQEMTYENFKIYLEKEWKKRITWREKIKRKIDYLCNLKEEDKLIRKIIVGVGTFLVVVIICLIVYFISGKKLPMW